MATKRIESVDKLIKCLSSDLEEGREHWYRGQINYEWKLNPSILRMEGGISSEVNLISRFKQNAVNMLDRLPINELEWLTVMQHYGVPTRLLDWSESPLVALYFAVEDANDGNCKDGSLWILKPKELNNISSIDLDYIPGLEHPLLKDYEPFIMHNDNTRRTPLAIITMRNTRRIQAQLGVFTINHKDGRSIEELGDKSHIIKYKIPSESKKRIKSELEILGFDDSKIYPDLENLAKHVRRRR